MTDRSKRTAALDKAIETMIQLYGGLPLRINNQPRIDKHGRRFFPRCAPIGCSDWIAIMPHGVTLWIEGKVSPDKMRETQLQFRDKLWKRGHKYILVQDTTDILVAWLSKDADKAREG